MLSSSIVHLGQVFFLPREGAGEGDPLRLVPFLIRFAGRLPLVSPCLCARTFIVDSFAQCEWDPHSTPFWGCFQENPMNITAPLVSEFEFHKEGRNVPFCHLGTPQNGKMVFLSVSLQKLQKPHFPSSWTLHAFWEGQVSTQKNSLGSFVWGHPLKGWFGVRTPPRGMLTSPLPRKAAGHRGPPAKAQAPRGQFSGARVGGFGPCCGWTKPSSQHPKKPMGNQRLQYNLHWNILESSFQGFLGGAGFRPLGGVSFWLSFKTTRKGDTLRQEETFTGPLKAVYSQPSHSTSTSTSI